MLFTDWLLGRSLSSRQRAWHLLRLLLSVGVGPWPAERRSPHYKPDDAAMIAMAHAEPCRAGDEFSVCNPPHPYFNEEGCKARFPQAYAITYWTHTW